VPDHLNDPALQLQFLFFPDVRDLRGSLMCAPPERPSDYLCRPNAPLRQPDGDATDFLDRPADQRWRVLDAFLKSMSFVFICIDGGAGKGVIVPALEDAGIPFIDTGIGVELIEQQMLGMVRITTSTLEKRDHLRDRVSFSDPAGDAAYRLSTPEQKCIVAPE